MLKFLRKAKEEPKKSQFEIGVVDGKIVIKFKEPVRIVELDRYQTLDLVEALTEKIVLTKKV